MDQGSISDFADTASGREFHARYDRVLGKWTVPVEGIDVTTRHGATRVNVCGPVEARPVVLLAGGGATSTSWFAVAGALAAGHRVLAVDLPGDPGRSILGDRMRSVDHLTAWLNELLDALGVESAAIVGHSYGAMVALAFATRHPERVDRLVLLDPNSCFAGFRASFLIRALPLLLRPTAARQRALIGWETAGSDVDADWLDLVAHAAEHFPTARPVVPKRPRRRELERLRCPVTVVLAEHSRVHDIGKVGDGVRQLLPGARTVVLADASHYTMPMTPATTLRTVLSDALRG